jgi:hypothetical protein
VVPDHGNRHDVKDSTGVRVFDIAQIVVSAAVAVDILDLSVDIDAISPFQVHKIVAMACGIELQPDSGKMIFHQPSVFT